MKRGLDLAPGVVYTYYIAVASTKDGGEAEIQGAFDKAAQWYADHISVDYNPEDCSCCVIRGDVNHSGGIDVSDLTYIVDYLFAGGAAPPCDIEGDVNGSGGIDVSDLTFIVDYLFAGGAAPPPC